MYRDFERWYLRSVDGLICTSAFTEQEATGLSGGPSVVAYPGGRLAEQDGIQQIEPTDTDGSLRVLFVGTLIRRKGARTLVNALAGVDGDWTAAIAGDLSADRSYARSVRDRIDRHGLGEQFSLLGCIDGERLVTELDRADVLAVPSRYEGSGMLYLEAMERGTVPIGGRLGGAAEFITHTKNGFLVGPEDSNALRDIIGGLCSDRERLSELSAAALASAQEHPPWSESLDQAREFMLDRIA